ncbi:MAG: hypothetical protein AAF471_04755, partial [Myxococcota bacterium]
QMLAEMSENASSVYIASRAACWLAWLSPGLCKRYYASSCSLKAKALLGWGEVQQKSGYHCLQ